MIVDISPATGWVNKYSHVNTVRPMTIIMTYPTAYGHDFNHFADLDIVICVYMHILHKNESHQPFGQLCCYCLLSVMFRDAHKVGNI